METQVLIPQEFSLVLTAPGGKKSREQVATVFSTVRIPQSTVFYPFQGTVRIDKLEISAYLEEHDVSMMKTTTLARKQVIREKFTLP
jgi:hypothetical protein